MGFTVRSLYFFPEHSATLLDKTFPPRPSGRSAGRNAWGENARFCDMRFRRLTLPLGDGDSAAETVSKPEGIFSNARVTERI
jgi:hypothetical protein